jgi:hypothetical protein
MTDLFAQLLDQYDRFRGEIGRIEEKEALVRAQKLLDDVEKAGKVIANPDERGVLSDLAYDLGGIIFDYSGFYPSVRLMPLADEAARQQSNKPTEEDRHRGSSFADALLSPVWQGVGMVVALVALLAAVYPFFRDAFVMSVMPTPKPPTLCNGTFDDRFECWEHGGELKQSVKCEGGQCYAVLGSPDYECEGGVPMGEAWIKQSFQISPTIATSPTLSLKYRVFSYDLDIQDWLQVWINDDLVGQFGNPLWSLPSCDREPWDSGWQTAEFDLSRYEGQNVEVLLSNVNSKYDWWNTWTYVDDVQVR